MVKNRKNNYCVYVHIFPNKKKYVGLFDSAKTASETLKVNATSIALVCKGKKPQVGGYTFRYFNEEEGSEDGQ